jgi:glutamyl-tRNA synthetase
MKTNYSTFLGNSDKPVRLRFAPSPTGALHIGGVRTALYNYLFAKKNNGKLILRIEDTDSTRFVSGAEKYIKESFDWLGIEFDEGPDIGGSYGPYRQSERRDLYYDFAIKLVSEGKAYFAFDTSDELDAAREKIENFSYNSETRNSMRNSLTMSHAEANEIMKTSNDFVIRIKYPDQPIDITFDDMVRGSITINTATLDDKVIWKKKDELPTYHLANVVDDHLMEISHVIRGEEWIPSTPLHVYLYQSFGWDTPLFAHLPLILGPNGKLSKRDGDKYGFPVFPLEWVDPKDDSKVSMGYKQMGYTPEAVVNILAFLGWNPGTDKEIYTMDELINDFDISRVNKAGAKFNQDKAKWFNGQHIKSLTSYDLIVDFMDELKKKGIDMDIDTAAKILEANKNKVNFVKDILDEASYLFGKPTNFDPKGLKKWKPTSSELLDGLSNVLHDVTDWVEDKIQNSFESYVKDNNIKFGDIAPQLRLVLTGKANGPSLFGIMELLGKDESIDRLTNYDLPKSDDSTKQSSDGQVNHDIEKLQGDVLDLILNNLPHTSSNID